MYINFTLLSIIDEVIHQKVGYGRHTDQRRLNTTQNGVFGVLWHLRRQGYSEYTIYLVRKALKVLEDGCGARMGALFSIDSICVLPVQLSEDGER